MTITQDKILKNALFDVQLMELDYIDTLPKYDISNSEKINNSIKEISESFKAPKKRISNKLVFILVAAIITTLLVVSISASQKIKEFIVDVYESFISITIKGDNDKENLEAPMQEFVANYVPEGYIKATTNKYPARIITVWNNEKHDITLTQDSPRNNDIKLDNESSDYQEFMLNETTVYYWHKYNTNAVMWVQDNYIFSLSCHDSVSLEEIKKIVSSIVPIE